MRTPKNIIELAKNKLGEKSLVIDTVDKKAYLSALISSKIYCCNMRLNFNDFRSCITGKPIYVADIPAKKNDHRIKKFKELFTSTKYY